MEGQQEPQEVCDAGGCFRCLYWENCWQGFDLFGAYYTCECCDCYGCWYC
jgi:hypothetical protein